MLHEMWLYITEHPEYVEEYFGQRVAGKKRIQRLMDVMMKRYPVQLIRLMYGEPGEMPVEEQAGGGVNQIQEPYVVRLANGTCYTEQEWSRVIEEARKLHALQ